MSKILEDSGIVYIDDEGCNVTSLGIPYLTRSEPKDHFCGDFRNFQNFDAFCNGCWCCNKEFDEYSVSKNSFTYGCSKCKVYITVEKRS